MHLENKYFSCLLKISFYKCKTYRCGDVSEKTGFGVGEKFLTYVLLQFQ